MQEMQPSIIPNAQRQDDVLWHVDDNGVATKIGRASCRERVLDGV